MWLGQTAAEQQEALSKLQIQQMEGGQHHGMYVASDAVAKLLNMLPQNARKKVRNMVADGISKLLFVVCCLLFVV